VKFNGSNWTIYNNINSGLPNNKVQDISIDANGHKWIATSGGLAKFDDFEWTVFNTSNSGLPNDNVNCVIIEQNFTKWIGTINGLAKFTDSTWTIYNVLNSAIPHNYVFSIRIDKNKNKWIGTYFGIGVFNENGITLTIEENLSNSIQPIPLINIYPNPTSDELFVETDFNHQYKVQILDPVGKIVAEYTSDDALLQMNVSKLSSGFYVLVIRAGNEVRTAKFVKQ
jgi:ligand-binding sensor domain-containing protein